MAVVNERMIAGPHLLDDLHARIMAVRMDRDQPAARTERPGERRNHPFGLECQRGPRPIWLRGHDQVVTGDRAAGARNGRVEQEAVIGAIDDQHDGALIHRIAGLGADSRLPVLGQERHQVGDLLLEPIGGFADQRLLVPDQARGRAQ